MKKTNARLKWIRSIQCVMLSLLFLAGTLAAGADELAVLGVTHTTQENQTLASVDAGETHTNTQPEVPLAHAPVEELQTTQEITQEQPAQQETQRPVWRVTFYDLYGFEWGWADVPDGNYLIEPSFVVPEGYCLLHWYDETDPTYAAYHFGSTVNRNIKLWPYLVDTRSVVSDSGQMDYQGTAQIAAESILGSLQPALQEEIVPYIEAHGDWQTAANAIIENIVAAEPDTTPAQQEQPEQPVFDTEGIVAMISEATVEPEEEDKPFAENVIVEDLLSVLSRSAIGLSPEGQAADETAQTQMTNSIVESIVYAEEHTPQTEAAGQDAVLDSLLSGLAPEAEQETVQEGQADAPAQQVLSALLQESAQTTDAPQPETSQQDAVIDGLLMELTPETSVETTQEEAGNAPVQQMLEALLQDGTEQAEENEKNASEPVADAAPQTLLEELLQGNATEPQQQMIDSILSEITMTVQEPVAEGATEQPQDDATEQTGTTAAPEETKQLLDGMLSDINAAALGTATENEAEQGADQTEETENANTESLAENTLETEANVADQLIDSMLPSGELSTETTPVEAEQRGAASPADNTTGEAGQLVDSLIGNVEAEVSGVQEPVKEEGEVTAVVINEDETAGVDPDSTKDEADASGSKTGDAETAKPGEDEDDSDEKEDQPLEDDKKTAGDEDVLTEAGDEDGSKEDDTSEKDETLTQEDAKEGELEEEGELPESTLTEGETDETAQGEEELNGQEGEENEEPTVAPEVTEETEETETEKPSEEMNPETPEVLEDFEESEPVDLVEIEVELSPLVDIDDENVPGKDFQPSPEEEKAEDEAQTEDGAEDTQEQSSQGIPDDADVTIDCITDGSEIGPGSFITLVADLNSVPDDAHVEYQWQHDRGAGYENVPGATGNSYSYIVEEEYPNSNWRVIVKVTKG